MANIKLSIIIPCFNEENRFGKGFDHYYSYLSKQKYPWELILVNDGSTDETLRLMQKASRKSPNVEVLSYKQNHGKGYAIAQGVKKAKGKYLLFSDIDHSVPIETIESFNKYFKEGYQVVIGSRRVKGAKIEIHQPFGREFLGKGFSFLVKFLIDSKIKDATCGFKAFEGEVAEKIFSKISIFDWAFDAELLFLTKKFHYKIIQAPVVWKNVRGTKVNLQKDVLRSLIGLVKIRLNDLQGKYSS